MILGNWVCLGYENVPIELIFSGIFVATAFTEAV
jgi:hypothetical protein